MLSNSKTSSSGFTFFLLLTFCVFPLFSCLCLCFSDHIAKLAQNTDTESGKNTPQCFSTVIKIHSAQLQLHTCALHLRETVCVCMFLICARVLPFPGITCWLFLCQTHLQRLSFTDHLTMLTSPQVFLCEIFLLFSSDLGFILFHF